MKKVDLSQEMKVDRDREGVAAVLAVVPMLYLAWFLTWFGTFATTCTGSDPKSLGAGMILSMLFYAAAIFGLHRSDLGVGGLVLAFPLSFLLLWQAVWGAKLFLVVNVSGLSACNLMMGEGYGEARGGWIELLYAPYYVLVSVGSLAAILLSHQRYRKAKKG